MRPERDPEIASVELRKQSVMWAREDADRVRHWWIAMARSRRVLDKPVHKPSAPQPEFGTDGMTRKMEAETAKRVAESMDALERTKPVTKPR